MIRRRDHICLVEQEELRRRMLLLSETNLLAGVVVLMLDIESNNISAKSYVWSEEAHRRNLMHYSGKQSLIVELLTIYQAQGWVFGVHHSDKLNKTTHIIYFELPTGKHVSWHYSPHQDLPTYQKEWDGLRNSTFTKLGEVIEAAFPDINAAERRAEEKRLVRNAQARKRYAAKAPERKAARAAWRSQFLNDKELKERDWSDSMIADLGAPDCCERRGWWYYDLYRVGRTTAVEHTKAGLS